jgi:DNA/RNA-binding domain of Phe-tRNA-synthetase-like protein
MKYIVEKEMFEKYPDLTIGVVLGRGLKIEKTNEELRLLVSENVSKFISEFQGINLLDHPNVNVWRDTYKSFGVKPKDHKPTAEALLRRVLNGHPFPNINTAVDAYLAVELLYYLPIGGYDLQKVKSNICLKISTGGESFIPLGGESLEYSERGEVVYCDGEGVITRRWNYRDAERTKIDLKSTDIILATEVAFNTIDLKYLHNTVDKILEYEEKYCGGNYDILFLNKDKREVEIGN